MHINYLDEDFNEARMKNILFYSNLPIFNHKSSLFGSANNHLLQKN